MNDDKVIDAAARFTGGETGENPLALLQQANSETIESLRTQGVELNPIMLLELRLNVLTEMLLPVGGPFRDVFEVLYADNLATHLADAQSNVNKAKLLAPPTPPRGEGA